MTAAPSPLAEVRQAAAWVSDNARSVRLAGEPGSYARSLLAEQGGAMPSIEWDSDTHFRGSAADTAAFVLTLDAINFGSGYFPSLDKRPGRSGYFTVALALSERFERHGPFSAAELRGLDRSAVSSLLGQRSGDPVREELMELYARALNELGAFLEAHFDGSALRLVEAAAGSAESLIGLLLGMPLFRDFSRYRGRSVPLLKRAQITASDLALARPRDPVFAFRDLDRLTIFADNLVPHVLRVDGLLEYEPGLAARLERGELIPPGSEEEVEIRAVALHAVEEMNRCLLADGIASTPRQLDLLLWNRGQAARYRGGSKHRTRTTNY